MVFNAITISIKNDVDKERLYFIPVFPFGLSAIYQSVGSTIMIVFGTTPFAVGYFLPRSYLFLMSWAFGKTAAIRCIAIIYLR